MAHAGSDSTGSWRRDQFRSHRRGEGWRAATWRRHALFPAKISVGMPALIGFRGAVRLQSGTTRDAIKPRHGPPDEGKVLLGQPEQPPRWWGETRHS